MKAFAIIGATAGHLIAMAAAVVFAPPEYAETALTAIYLLGMAVAISWGIVEIGKAR